MATLSTHTLNSVDGTHAGPIALCVYRIEANGGRTEFLSGETDDGGRFSAEFELEATDLEAEFELVLQTGNYFSEQGVKAAQPPICREAVIRFSMPDRNRRYHIPLMLAPNSYSVWWSS